MYGSVICHVSCIGCPAPRVVSASGVRNVNDQGILPCAFSLVFLPCGGPPLHAENDNPEGKRKSSISFLFFLAQQ